MSAGAVVQDISETPLHGTGVVQLDENGGETKAMSQEFILQNTRVVMQGLDQLKTEHNSILHR